MGDGQSRPAEGDEAWDPAVSRRLHAKLEGANIPVDKAFEEAYRGDEASLEGIKRIVDQLNGIAPSASAGQLSGPQPPPVLGSRPPAGSTKDVRRGAHERAVGRAAEKGADDWLRKQIAMGRRVTAQKPRVLDAGEHSPPPPPPILAIPDAKARPKAATTRTGATAGPAPPTPELYRILGVGLDATFEEIKKAYHREALRWHPDKNRGRMHEATGRFQRITDAFDTLYDPERRAVYDSGQVRVPAKAKRLAGYGWSKFDDHEDAALTPAGLKLKKLSWNGYIYFGGRIDDEDPVLSDDDPRAPEERVKIFWRFIGEKAHDARESGGARWLSNFLREVWSGTPSKWPHAVELSQMNEASHSEWKERRMVYSRRREKVLIHLELHEEYLDIPNREEKEKARMRKIWPDSFGRPAGLPR